ncbi:hypothetical protein [Spirilliplanes yamanashiensis]|uniref:Uncharacterized protein n=1 Tax=Spirilliplanes yamanashiensis TaxID=42233 RepID=A0A8J3YC74_9ACTN|nr:hypothetical protein [Spirilliplanes yamanashiensis]MDP9818846.1 hypothetical protein [Spirilliplanes yamanashiensis]GIJ05300.1 hypothetical protein Sya03_46520 [Spirilliplanes yamanashiensis]
MAEPPSWAEQRRQAVAGHAAALEAARAAEAAEGRALIADFVRRAAAAGLEPGPLAARALSGGATYRTALRGWYLKSNRSVAVGADGGYYVLSVPPSLRARLRGAAVEPSDPRLVVGAGGGDGESVPLKELLERRLTLPARWPG